MFVESKKIRRKIGRVRKQLCDDLANSELRHQLGVFEDQLLYIQKYPKDKPYISIFTKIDEDSKSKRNEILKNIKERERQERTGKADQQHAGSSVGSADDFFVHSKTSSFAKESYY